ncbi:hypothetical protein AVEN_129898-1 [Araneus ventricosus]|uniref:Uncharacterized protein n=1 Tax=Araneus ventricosus TaxID=182803 RepID=A0A4Y2QZV8_ARAVE|nr:hypothetical protein AVEN_129898-1 [Araneus ventricosus]
MLDRAEIPAPAILSQLRCRRSMAEYFFRVVRQFVKSLPRPGRALRTGKEIPTRDRSYPVTFGSTVYIVPSASINTFLPFFRRGCPGESMDYLELFPHFTSILREFEVAFPDGENPTFDGEYIKLDKMKPYIYCGLSQNNNRIEFLLLISSWKI